MIVPLVNTGLVAVLARMMLLGVFTVVAALEQLAVAQLLEGVGGLAPPVVSTEA